MYTFLLVILCETWFLDVINGMNQNDAWGMRWQILNLNQMGVVLTLSGMNENQSLYLNAA